MATRFHFVIPGTENTATFGLPPYVRRSTKAVGDQTVNRPIEEDLFDYLYPYPVLANSPAEQKQMATESNFEKIQDQDGRSSVLFKADIVTGAKDVRVASAEYNNRLAVYKENYFRNTVSVYQRFWAATHAGSEKPLIATMGIVLCVFVVIYDRINKVAAAAHLDKDQKSEDIASIIPGVFPGNGALDIYIVGGRPSDRTMEEATRRNIQGQLRGFFECSKRFDRQMTVRMFEVIGRPHPSDVTFDTRSGRIMPMYNGAPPSTVKGQPLDTVCRYWPNGKYWVEEDSSGLAVEGNKLRTAVPPNIQLADDLTLLRCQWEGTVAGWPAFYAQSNERICRLNVQFAFEYVKVDPTALDNVNADLTNLLIQLDKPMMLEQSLKIWVKWKDALERLGLEKAAELDKGVTMERGEMSLTSHIVRILKSFDHAPTKVGILNRFNEMLPRWIDRKDFAVDWEGRH